MGYSLDCVEWTDAAQNEKSDRHKLNACDNEEICSIYYESAAYK